MNTAETNIAQTKKWISDVVIGCNFCPFAAKELKNDTIRYFTEESADPRTILSRFMLECQRMDNEPSIETTLIILSVGYPQFEKYLDLVSMAETLLEKEGYEGIYQVAGFHPEYMFSGSTVEDPANYTNRSPYPMLHLLREATVEAVLKKYSDPQNIPANNIKFANEKGLNYMRNLRESCL